MNIYRIYYKYGMNEHWLYIKAKIEQEAREIFKNNMKSEIEIEFINEAKEHQIVKNDITLNFIIDFEKDYICG